MPVVARGFFNADDDFDWVQAGAASTSTGDFTDLDFARLFFHGGAFFSFGVHRSKQDQYECFQIHSAHGGRVFSLCQFSGFYIGSEEPDGEVHHGLFDDSYFLFFQVALDIPDSDHFGRTDLCINESRAESR